MNKNELITAVHNNNDNLTKKQVEQVISTFFNVTANELKSGGAVRYHGFGSFTVSQRNARKGRNPQTGKAMNIPAKRIVKFKAAKTLSETVNV